MAKEDYKAKVQMSYRTAICVKGYNDMFYVQDLPFGPEEGVKASTASGAWRQAFWGMPVEERNKSIS